MHSHRKTAAGSLGYAPAPMCTHIPTQMHARTNGRVLPQTREHWQSEGTLLICWLREFNGEPNTHCLFQIHLSSAERQRGESERKDRNTSVGMDTREEGGQKEKRKREKSMIVLLCLKKGKCIVSADVGPTFRCPGAFPFMCRANYQVIFSETKKKTKTKPTDALH